MEGVVSFFDKTIKEKNTKIETTKGILKRQLETVEKNEYEEKHKTIKSNEGSTKKIIHQQKFKKFNNWLLDLCGPRPPALLYGPWPSAPGPRPSYSANVLSISANLKQVAELLFAYHVIPLNIKTL